MNSSQFEHFSRHSDDPLISGAIDDNQNEFEAIASCKPLPVASPTICTTYKKPPRTRKKGQVKLRFHHQALPQEYLEHFEASQNHGMGKDFDVDAMRDKNKAFDDIDHMQEQKINDSMQLWLQKVTEIHDDKVAGERLVTKHKPEPVTNANNTAKKPSRVVSYNDLPYMGEMTLENSKPRRGRKPKKADICHLIYKNYGTVFPDQPPKTPEVNDNETTPNETKRTNVQNKLMNSLLEKRLTQQEQSRNVTAKTTRKSERKTQTKVEEPLNLCIRDIYDGDIQVISGDENDDLASLIASNDLSLNPLFSSSLKMALPNFQSAMLDTRTPSSDASVNISENLVSTNNWLASNAFMHPMALYLHKMADPQAPPKLSPKSGTPAKPVPEKANILVPKKISELVKDNVSMASVPGSCKTKIVERNTPPASSSSTKTSTTTSSPSIAPAPKRKRSAIFIPPVPEESSTNHATEVSICKFKFTGGAKPSLQEKKMLSVDAGGNFRYYSGTGDKSIRGYEFFPRESLQQSSLMGCSSAGAFLNTPGKRISADLPPPSHGLSNEVLQLPPDILTTARPTQPTTSTLLPHEFTGNTTAANNKNRKRKSKRSVQREKLEKTFKEKGFLIQTQQLQSAEGATYCKFRQLRKFTRYLFRSWKDYLPGELQQGAIPPGAQQQVTAIENEQQPTTPAYLTPSTSTGGKWNGKSYTFFGWFFL